VTDSVEDLIDMARALSEGEFEAQFQMNFKGDLGQLAAYLEALRQMLRSLSAAANHFRELIPQAAHGVADINREAENGFNSVWEVIERFQSHQAEAAALLKGIAAGGGDDNATKLRVVVENNQRDLLDLMSYLSFQDVLRQRLEKLQLMIGQVEEKLRDVIIKIGVKNGETSIKDGGDSDKDADLNQSLVDRLIATLK
jgi:hypothetical protein